VKPVDSFAEISLKEHPKVVFPGKAQIKTTTLDKWAEEQEVEKVYFLWLDLQGHEPAVLKASLKILSTVKIIYTEVSLKQLDEGTLLYPEFRIWLREKGFRVNREELAWKDTGNVLFVRE
jgi:hypothetical protein